MNDLDHHTNGDHHQEHQLTEDPSQQQPPASNKVALQESHSPEDGQHQDEQAHDPEIDLQPSSLSDAVHNESSISDLHSKVNNLSMMVDQNPLSTYGNGATVWALPTNVLDGEQDRSDSHAQRPHQTNDNGHIEMLPGEIKGADLPEVIPTLWEAFVDSAARYPQNLAIASVHQKGEVRGYSNLPLDHDAYKADPYLRWSYSDFAKAVIRVIQALQAEQITEGCLVFTFCTNSAEFVALIWAAMALGCIVVPIHSRALLNKEEVLHVIGKAKITARVDRIIGFAQNSALARQIVNLEIAPAERILIMDDDMFETTWRSFTTFLPDTASEVESDLARYNQSAREWALIIFTSGTTALPKGVVLDSYRLDRIIATRRASGRVVPGDSCFLPLPNNHIFFHFFALLTPGVGAGIVLPSPTFQPQHAPEIMELERCAHFPMSPTMVHAIKDILTAKGIKFSSLKNIPTGGAKLSVEFIEACFNIIGSQGVEILYGSTEGCATVGTGVVTNAEDIIKNGDASVGRPCLGCTIKICRPGGTEPLPLNTEGDLHYSTVTLCDGYAGGDKPETFYTDERGREWFATGDAATINEEGMVFIVGRIKDMIIRGGVNIAPAAMEFVLAKNPVTAPFNIQVVGKLDAIAGEVPIAVSTKSVTLEDIEKIQKTVLDQMGPIYEPEEILTLEQLALEDFPRTLLGKVQKGKLTEVVRKFISDRAAPDVGYIEKDDLTDKVQKVWLRTIGHGVKVDTDISSFADSITIMRVRDRFKKDLGADISLAEMLSLNTVDDQIKAIRERSEKKTARTTERSPIQVSAEGPKIDDIVHLALAPQLFGSTQAYISDKIGKYGLEWNDIQDITPASDFTSALVQADVQNTGWSWKFAFLANEGMSKKTLRERLEVMLANNPMLTSFLFTSRAAFGSDISLYVMPKPTTKLFNSVFRDYGSITTRQEFADEVYKPYEYQMAMVPDHILVNFLLFEVKDCNRAGTIMVVNHAVIDATYMQLMFDDFDKALGGLQPLEPHTSYKIWADSYYCLRTSFEAQVMVAWQVRRLEDLVALKRSVFPPPHDPHNPTVRSYAQDVSDNGYHVDFHVPGITYLRSKNPLLSAPTIVKAAWSLLNIHRNKTDTALFSNLQADRRRFPFVPKALELLSPAHTFEATRVAGPTLQDAVNIVTLYPEESVLDFMHRVASDQEDLNKHAAAPLKTVLKDIGPINAEVMIDVLRSQIFNWTTGLGALQTHNPNENYEPVSSFIRPKLRLVINVDVGGADDETCFAQIKSPLFDKDGLKSIADDLEDILTWLCDAGNWTRRTADFKTALRHDEERSMKNGHAQKTEHYL